MKVLFLHGLESTPGGKKPAFYLEHGHEVLNPALSDEDFEQALRVGQEAFDQGHPQIVVGSSRGGAVAMNLDIGSTPLLVVCPAWMRWGQATSVKPGSVILHSAQDEVVPFSFSQQLHQASPGSRLVEAGSDHRMADPEILALMLRLSEEMVAG